MPLSPDSSNPLTGVMQSIMLRYHADMEAQVEHTLADLAGRWQGVRASLAETITRLERQMTAAKNAGDVINYTWLSQERRLLDLKMAVQGDIAKYAQLARQVVGDAQMRGAQLGLAAAQAKLDALTPPGVNYTWGVPPRDVLDQIAGATQPYTPLYALFEQMGAQAATNAAQALFQSVALGEGPREAARRLVWATDMSARRAEVIARTEIHRAWRQAQFANYQANSDVVSSWMWSADFASERTCGACVALDGSIHPLDEELADHVCGRCDAIPVTRPWSDILAGTGIPDDELAALDEGDASTWMDYRESGGEWLARQPIDTQNRVLGPAKAEAWRQGVISLRDVAGITHDPTWGRSIEERSLKSLGIDAQKWLAAARSNGTAATTMSEEAQQALSEWEQQRAAAIAEVKAAEAEAASGAAAQPSEWEARRAAAIAEAEGFGTAAPSTQALAGSANDAAVSPVWQQVADKLHEQEEGGAAFAPLAAPGGGSLTSYELTAEDKAFAQALRDQIPPDGITSSTDAIALGQQLSTRVNSQLTDLQAYADEAALIRQTAPNLTDAQRAWALGDKEAMAVHGGVRWTQAATELQNAYQAQMRAYLSEVRDLGGVEVNVADGADALVAERLAAAQELLPADWLQASNDLGEINLIKSTERSSSGWFTAASDGSGTLAVRYIKASDLADLESTALHEMTHRMEQVIPTLSDLEKQFYDARTAGDAFVDLTNGIKARTKLDDWADQYLGREPLAIAGSGYYNSATDWKPYRYSYELLTMGVEMLFAPGVSPDTFLLRADREYEAFVLGALLGVKAP